MSQFETLDRMFKFKIGDIVYFKLMGTEWDPKCNEKATQFYILSRIIEECPGGIQLSYSCRGFNNISRGFSELYRFNEIELAKME